MHAFQHPGDGRRGQAEIAVSALLLHGQQAGGLHLGEMTAGRLRRDAGAPSQFARSQRPTVHQGGQHLGPRRIADQADCPAEEVANIKILGDLDSVFERNARTDHYLLDRQLAGRNCAGELYLTVWGGLVLDYLEKQDTYEYEFGRDAETQVKKGLSVIENDNAAEPELP